MKISFVRHGETISNKNATATGWIDSPLTEEGFKQVEEMTKEIPTDFSKIYSSDLTRCKQTTEIINKKLNLPIIYDARLKERNFGSLAGKTWDEIGSDLRKLDANQQFDYRPFGGESAEKVKDRLFKCIEEIKNNEKGEKILVVSHAGIIRLLHNELNSKVHEQIHNSSLHEFEFKDD